MDHFWHIATCVSAAVIGVEPGRKRARNAESLVDAMHRVLNGTELTVTELADRLEKRGALAANVRDVHAVVLAGRLLVLLTFEAPVAVGIDVDSDVHRPVLRGITGGVIG